MTPKAAIARLLLAGQHADVAAQRLLGPGDELLAVRGLARRGRGQRIDLLGADLPGQRAKPPQRRQGPVMPSSPSLPLVATPRPRPQRIFSLKIG